MQMIDQIQVDASQVLRHVLAHYAAEYGAGSACAIACECDPGAASLYVHIACDGDDLFDDPTGWSHAFIEQDCPAYAQPSWFEQFDELNQCYFQSDEEDESAYAEIERYFQRILQGVAQALVAMRSELVQLSYPADIQLAVATEDDDSADTKFDRIQQVELH